MRPRGFPDRRHWLKRARRHLQTSDPMFTAGNSGVRFRTPHECTALALAEEICAAAPRATSAVCLPPGHPLAAAKKAPGRQAGPAADPPPPPRGG